MSELPRVLQKLKPWAAEDFLCYYASAVGTVRFPVSAAAYLVAKSGYGLTGRMVPGAADRDNGAGQSAVLLGQRFGIG